MDFKNIEETMSLLEQWVSEKTGKALTPVETRILQQSLEDKTYEQMEIQGYSMAYIKTMVSPKLWKHLSEVAGTPVNKKNCQLVLKGILAEFENKSQLKLQEIQESEVGQSVTENSSRIAPQSTPMNPYFIGRENAIAHLKTKINQGAKIILIQAAAGIGKTTLATEFLKNQNFDKILYLTMAKERETISPVESIVEEWLKKDFDEEPGRDFMVSLGRLKRLLQNQKIGILIDNLEPALDSEFRFIEPHRRYIELLRMLTDSMVQSVTLITSRERLCEGDITVETYRLPELDYCAWKQYFEYYQINNHESILIEMHKSYGGNAKAMRILCGAIQEDDQGDIQSYWNCNKAEILAKPDLKDLVNSQFKRLQELDINAFKLLCRLGCYRYQDVPTVPDNGLLCLLWDVPEGEQRRVIESLKNRSLVEFNQGEYWLHPMIREEAISRLRSSEDWENANRKAAEFWLKNSSEIKSLANIIILFFESFHHYCTIFDWSSAFKILEKKVDFDDFNHKLSTQVRYWGYSQYLIDSLNKLEGKLSNINDDEAQRLGHIGVSFYYLSNYTKAIEYLERVQELFKNTSAYYYTRAMYWLGKSHARLGNFSLALSYCDQALEQVEKLKKRQEDYGSSECATLNVIGSIYMDLGEYEKAIENHKEVLKLSPKSRIRYFRNEGDALAYIACCELAIGNYTEAINTIQESIRIFQQVQDYVSECIAQCFLGEFYLLDSQIKNAGQTIESIENLRKKIKYFHPGLKTYWCKMQASFSLYKNDYNQAIKLYNESIVINQDIGAKRDLAEAYYQRGLTYQQMGDRENSQPNFDNAIQLFTEIEAPRQVERVIKSII
jgi:tetratricopeptide (TPR) repeat protein